MGSCLSGTAPSCTSAAHTSIQLFSLLMGPSKKFRNTGWFQKRFPLTLSLISLKVSVIADPRCPEPTHLLRSSHSFSAWLSVSVSDAVRLSSDKNGVWDLRSEGGKAQKQKLCSQIETAGGWVPGPASVFSRVSSESFLWDPRKRTLYMENERKMTSYLIPSWYQK